MGKLRLAYGKGLAQATQLVRDRAGLPSMGSGSQSYAPSLPTYWLPSRYHLAGQRFKRKVTAKCRLTAKESLRKLRPGAWAGRKDSNLRPARPGACVRPTEISGLAWERPSQPFLRRAGFTEVFPLDCVSNARFLTPSATETPAPVPVKGVLLRLHRETSEASLCLHRGGEGVLGSGSSEILPPGGSGC